MAKQTETGKAFEYALLIEFFERLQDFTNITVKETASYKTAKKCFHQFDDVEQGNYKLAASFAVNFLIDVEPKLSNCLDKGDILELEIVSDKLGQSGDVRDVLAIRLAQQWEVGISAKNNHRAVKHSRLSNDIDFGQKWLGINCSTTYFEEIKPVFLELARQRNQSKATKEWNTLGDYHESVYVPVLNAFKKELLRLDQKNPGIVSERLVQYLIGNEDFYKVIKSRGKVEIQAYNFNGSLNKSFENIKPKAKIPKLKLPNRLIEIVYQNNSKTTLLVTLNEGWQISFRIHNASSRIEPSLKFDINLVSSPHSLFTNKFFT